MPTPKVDTFESDIAEEIKRKDAAYGEVASELVPPPVTTAEVSKPIKPAPVFLIVLIAFFSSGVIGLICLAYYYFTDSLLPPSQKSLDVNQHQVPKVAAPLATLSKTLNAQIGTYVTGVEKRDVGYIISINSYSPVFAYMVKNEDSYMNELATTLYPQVVGTVATSTPVTPRASSIVAVASTTPPILVSTTTEKTATTTSGTSTKPSSKKTKTKSVPQKPTTGTSTPNTSTTTEEVLLGEKPAPVTTSAFTDVTISNQNMRVWKMGDQTVVYAFITTEKIAIATSTDAILAIKNVIIH